MRSVSTINSIKINDSEYTFLRSYALVLSDLFANNLQCFFKTASDGSLILKLCLPNTKVGDPVPNKKVRIREVYTTDVNIKKGLNQQVILRNNHHVLVYKDKDEVFCAQGITFWQAIKRKKAG